MRNEVNREDRYTYQIVLAAVAKGLRLVDRDLNIVAFGNAQGLAGMVDCFRLKFRVVFLLDRPSFVSLGCMTLQKIRLALWGPSIEILPSYVQSDRPS